MKRVELRGILAAKPFKIWKAWSKKRKVVTGIIAAVMVLVSIVVLAFPRDNKRMASMQSIVSETTVKKSSISNTIVGTGNLEMDEAYSIKIPSDITIEEVKVESGDAVKKGDALAVVDKSSVLESMEEIQVQLDKLDEKINSVEDADETTVVKASVSGTIKKIYAEEGDSVAECISKKGALIVIAVNGEKNNTIEVIAGSGTVTDISVKKNEEIDKGDILLTIENNYSEEYQNLVEQRKELSSIFKTLTSMSVSGILKADKAGVIGSVNVSADSSSNASTTDSLTANPMSQNLSHTKTTANTLALVSLSTNNESQIREEVTTSSENDTTLNAENSTIETATSNNKESENNVGNTNTETKDNDESNGDTNIKASKGKSNNKTTTNNNILNKNEENNNVADERADTQGNIKQSKVENVKTTDSSENVSTSTTKTSASESTSSDEESNFNDEQITAFTIASNDTMILSVSVDELDINSVSTEQEAEITLDAIEDKTFKGTVTKVSNSASSSGNGVAKYTVQISISKDEQMKQGMNATATIVIEKKEEILLLPVTAIQERGNQSFVYTGKDSDGNLSDEVQITTGISDGDNVEIASGLSEGDTVYYQKTGKTADTEMFGNMQDGDMPDAMGMEDFGGDRGSKSFDGNRPDDMPQDMHGGGKQ